ncbi:MAG: hypothetical protein JWQ90_3953 [Hydrocarboniphaga sp.]|uniref:hypothetical protein n=1 Tax=Hydrocarboniphaga sp. TaxID=2033016 RepID=UPI002630C5D4|nr:hypothetical protein [Hydrocarboniphaga sp.]MDB5971503.1 hypothetical protein [Hydrocarboniphaga sp.]
MIERHQRFCVWAGFAFAPTLLIGLAIAGFLQPPSPALDAASIAQMFAEDRTRIRIGIWIATAGSPLLAFYVAALSHLIRQITQGHSPLITAQAVAGNCLLLEFIFPQMLWQAAAYRPERGADFLLMLNDVAWLCYVGIVGTAIVQMLILAIAILQDQRPEPLVPRWCAFLCLWCAFGVAGGSLCIFFTTGPFAWNGIIAWWVLVFSFFIWMVTMAYYMSRVCSVALLGFPSNLMVNSQ